MDFDLSEEQRLLSESVDRLMADRYTFSQRTAYISSAEGWSRELWKRYVDQGLLGVPFAERHGGFGGGPVEIMVVMEAFGKALALEPYLATVVLFGGAVQSAGTDSQKAALLRGIVKGELLGAFAHAERNSRYDLSDVQMTATRTGDRWKLDGEKTVVVHGGCADKLVVSARVSGGRRDREGIALFVVDARAQGVHRRSYSMHDSVRAADVIFKDVQVSVEDQLGEPGKGYATVVKVVQSGIQALAAEAVGGMQMMLDTTVEYLKTRRQFGVLIGSFQALQHKAVDMLVATEQARSMAMYAAMMVNDPDPVERAKAMSAVKVQIGKSGRYVSQQSVQLHGGMGMALEHHVSHYFLRASMIEILFGDTDHHLSKLAKAGDLIAHESSKLQTS